MINFVKKGPPAGGGKTTLVFLHGWGGAWQSWGPIIDKSQISKLKSQIFAVDLPGFGLSPLERAYELEDYVEDIRKFIQKEILVPDSAKATPGKSAIMNKVVLIGHSFGGQVAAKFVLLHPEMVSGLVLVDAAGVRRKSWKVKLAKLGSIRFLRNLRILRKFGRGLFGSEDYLAATGFLRETLKKISGDDLTKDYSKIKLPTLLFWGEKDPPELTPLEFGKLIHERIKGSKLVVAAGAGHFSYLDSPDAFVANLHEFVTNLHKSLLSDSGPVKILTNFQGKPGQNDEKRI